MSKLILCTFTLCQLLCFHLNQDIPIFSCGIWGSVSLSLFAPIVLGIDFGYNFKLFDGYSVEDIEAYSNLINASAHFGTIKKKMEKISECLLI